MEEWIVLLMLVFFGIGDVRKKSLSARALAAAFVIVGVLRLVLLGDVMQGIAGAVTGAMVCGMAKISRGQIGSGDGLLLTITGILLGFWGNMELFLAGLFFCAIFSAGAIILRHKGRGYGVPFVPFLAGAQLFRIFVLR